MKGFIKVQGDVVDYRCGEGGEGGVEYGRGRAERGKEWEAQK